MKKIIGILFVVFGIVLLPQSFEPSLPGTIGRLIGMSLVSFLPAYFLLRNSGKNEGADKEEKKDN